MLGGERLGVCYSPSSMRMRTILTLGIGFVLAASCSGPAGSVDDGRLSVVASFYPLAFAAERVGGDCVEVSDLTPPGVEPHDLELAPDDVASIATADVVLYLGGGFQPAVEDAIGEAQGHTIDLLRSVPTLRASEAIEGAPTVDPHVWLDPGRFATIATVVGKALEGTGAADGCNIEGRARDLVGKLEALDERFREGLADCDLDVIVTSHAAFGYLAAAYGLQQHAISGLEPDTEPNPKRLAEITAMVEREHVNTIFTEELVSPEVADTLAHETGARTAVLATIEGLTDEEAAAGEDYLSLMDGNLVELRSALGCR
jgi:zinc transport system substrate-binding protein